LAGQTGPQQSVIRFSHLPALVQTMRLHQPEGPHSTVQVRPPGLQAAPALSIFVCFLATAASGTSASTRQASAAIKTILIGFLLRLELLCDNGIMLVLRENEATRPQGDLSAGGDMAAAPTILVFDSGLGGLTVFREVARLRPDARLVYAADDAAFPYGRLAEGELVARVTAVVGGLIAHHVPDLVVIACNTASTLALPHLRARFSVPFVGTVPAIKPACAGSKSRLVSVLGTEATVAREYTKTLIRDFADGCAVTLVGSPHLAVLAEAALRGEPVEDAAVAREIAPCFVVNGSARTDTVVLACTHYPLLGERLARLATWPVAFVDPAPAIARRVMELLGPKAGGRALPATLHFTSGRPTSPALAAALARFGFEAAVAQTRS
jgi:glutamate racemase